MPDRPSNAPLTKAEQKTLAAHEAVIRRGLASFVEVGTALAAILKGRLYRGTHGSFEAYVAELWDMERRHAYRLIDASAVIADLCPSGHKKPPPFLPLNEFQARPLSKAEPEDRLPIWNAVLKAAPRVNGQPKITSQLVEAKRLEYTVPADDLARAKERTEEAARQQPAAESHGPGMFARPMQVHGDPSAGREVLNTMPAPNDLAAIGTPEDWREILAGPVPVNGSDPDYWNGRPFHFAPQLRGVAAIIRRLWNRHLGQHPGEIEFRESLATLLRSLALELQGLDHDSWHAASQEQRDAIEARSKAKTGRRAK